MKNIQEKLNRIAVLVDGGELERDLAMDLLRQVYEQIKFSGQSAASGDETFSAVPRAGGRVTDDLHSQVEKNPQPVPEEEEELETVWMAEPDPEFDPAPVKPVEEPVKPFTPRPVVKPEVIQSLYGENSAPASRPTPKTEPVEGQTLGDSLRDDTPIAEPKHTLGDALKAEVPGVPVVPSGVSLRKSIGLNDRFLMIRDMFRGDTAAFDRTIDQLDRFRTLDDAVIWLHDNFALDPDSEGVMLLMNLLERRFA